LGLIGSPIVPFGSDAVDVLNEVSLVHRVDIQLMCRCITIMAIVGHTAG
jgi:hypothetical protein